MDQAESPSNVMVLAFKEDAALTEVSLSLLTSHLQWLQSLLSLYVLLCFILKCTKIKPN